MANEILVLEGKGELEFEVCFLYPITSPVVVGSGNAVPFPVPTEGVIVDLLTTQEKADIAAGTLSYETIIFRKDAAATNPELIARLREMYASKKTVFDAAYAERYLHVGLRLNAVA